MKGSKTPFSCRWMFGAPLHLQRCPVPTPLICQSFASVSLILLLVRYYRFIMINRWPALRMLTFVSTDLLSLFRSVFPGFICSSHSFLIASTSLEHNIMDLRLHVLGFFRLFDLILFGRATFWHHSIIIRVLKFHIFCSKVFALS